MNANEAQFFDDPRKREFFASLIAERKICRVFERLRAADIEPILIKGWSIARFYPPDKKRFACDVDLCVPPREFGRAQKLIDGADFINLDVDLHRGFRHLDKLPFEDLFARSQIVKLGETRIRVLSAEDNLRVTAVHWLSDGGIDREKLWDVFYLVANRPADFDWNECLNAAGAIRRQWTICAIALAHRLFSLNVDDTPIAGEIKRPQTIPRWLLDTIERECGKTAPPAPLASCLKDWRALRRELGKRFPPNPITASVQTEAPFDDSPRLPYQIKNVFQRFFTYTLPLSIRKIKIPSR